MRQNRFAAIYCIATILLAFLISTTARGQSKPPFAASDYPPPEKAPSQEPTISQLRRLARTELKREANEVARSRSHVESIGRLLALHNQIVRHSTFAEGSALRETRGLLASRLIKIQQEIGRYVRRQTRRPAPRGGEPPGESIAREPESIHTADLPKVLRQIVPPVAANGPAGPVTGGGITAMPDYGEELAELIRQVISPQSWDVQGGEGVVVYFQPRQVLVIRATDEVHERLTTFLWDMRAANGP